MEEEIEKLSRKKVLRGIVSVLDLEESSPAEEKVRKIQDLIYRLDSSLE